MALQTKPQPGAGRIFKNPVLEALTKTHISIPLTLFWSVGAITLWYSMARLGISWRTSVTYFLGGMVLFTALTFEVEGGDRIGSVAWRPLLVIVGSVALFGVILPRLGMVISLPILIVMSAAASSEFHWKDALINAVVLTAFSWFIFIWGLKLTIPLWPTIGLPG